MSNQKSSCNVTPCPRPSGWKAVLANRDAACAKATALVLVVGILGGSPSCYIPIQDLAAKGLAGLQLAGELKGDQVREDVAALISSSSWLEENGFTVFEGMVRIEAPKPQ